ncbi:helix-turn-helix domain-containing protein [Rhodohalobacter barkolensis]|uniref:DUF4115 domain-containing protein n=1 Tax=Rhodohalobacter barkolensis TaxID=2053187 RepID=A0A2N0VLW3_9BACT|nr:helix-turn-helix domain-containing protein [Rhodohalobacter barkolensis]PKD45197.1 hypothetical protein CWD77_07040 [Rhodohalobacter barkolensis]
MPSIGKDLATIRKHLGLSIHDIQSATKIPLSTLESIEDNSIFEKSDEIQTYIRSFVRTYGRKLKLDDNLVLEALDSHEVGGYNHELLQPFPNLAPPAPKQAELPEPDKKTDSEKKDVPKEPEEGKRRSKIQPDFPAEENENIKEKDQDKPASTPAPKTGKSTSPPNVRSVNWADMGKRFSTNRSNTPIRLIGIAIVVLFVIALTYYLFSNDFFMSDDVQQTDTIPVPEETVTEENSGIPLDIDETPQEAEPAPPAELGETLYITIYAANDRLDPVRVWSDLKPRIDPYWMEQGTALNFEFSDTIRVRGQYNRMLLFMNGHRIDDVRQQFYNDEENAVELTRDIFEDDSKWRSTIPLELPPNVAEPDSVANRPSF